MFEDKELNELMAKAVTENKDENEDKDEKIELVENKPEQEEVKKEDNSNQEKEVFLKALAEAEAKEKAEIVKDPTKALNVKLSESLADTIENSQDVKEQVQDTAKVMVDRGLKTQRNKAEASVVDSEDEIIEADFRKNKHEYLYHGINHKIDKIWKRNLLHIINDIWFIIWAIVSCFSIVPISTFLSRIKALSGFIKGVAIVLGIILLIACLTGLTFMCLKWCGVIKF